MKKAIIPVVLAVLIGSVFFAYKTYSSVTGKEKPFYIIDADKAYEFLTTRGAIFIDNRPKEMCEEGRIPYALNMTYKSKGSEENFMSKTMIDAVMRRGKVVVMYCSGGTRTKNAIEQVVDWGYNGIFWLKGGFPEWKEKNYPIEVAANSVGSCPDMAKTEEGGTCSSGGCEGVKITTSIPEELQEQFPLLKGRYLNKLN